MLIFDLVNMIAEFQKCIPAQSLSVKVVFVLPNLVTAAVLLVMTTLLTPASNAAFKTFKVPLKISRIIFNLRKNIKIKKII